MKVISKSLFAGMLLIFMPCSHAVNINEIRIDQPSTDNDEYFELAGNPNESLDTLTYIVIGDSDSGTIEAVVNLDGLSLNTDGIFLATENSFTLGSADLMTTLNFENSDNVTHLLVKDFTGNNGDDLDTDNDGNLDTSPWSQIVDSIALIETPGSGDLTYSAEMIGPDGSFVPAHVYRSPDASGAWQIGVFDPDGGDDTPGLSNDGIVVPPPPPVATQVTIPEIQGLSHLSAFDGMEVQSHGVVTAVHHNGFYLQDPVGDNNSDTSDGIFVFTGSTPLVSSGDEIEIVAQVIEFIPGGAATNNLSITELINPELTLISSNNALPPAVIIGDAGRLPPTANIDDDGLTIYQPELDGVDFYESLEGMRVIINDAMAVSPINRFDEIFVVAEQGKGATGINTRQGITLRNGDYNPERVQIQVDEHFLPGFDPVVNVADRLGQVEGVISYSFGNYEVIATQPFNVTTGGLMPETDSIVGHKGYQNKKLTVASFNVLNLDPNDNDGTSDVADGQFQRIAKTIAGVLNNPDIIGLQEIQDNSGSDDDGVVDASETYQLLIDEIILAGGKNYVYADLPPVNNQDGGQPGGNIRVGFLFNPDRVDLIDGSLEKILDENLADGDAFLDSRKSLAAGFRFKGREVTVINNHFSSKFGSSPIFGQIQPFVNGQEEIRSEQAKVVKSYVNDLLALNPDAAIVVLGDLNEFDFESPLTELKGTEAPFLTNLTETLPVRERYSFIFRGNSQALDHMLVSPYLAGKSEFNMVHVNTEFADQASDHDPLLAVINFKKNPKTVRFATFNASLNRNSEGALIADLSTPDNEQAKTVAEIIQRSAPDVLLINEFDYDAKGMALRLFKKNYLEVSQNGQAPISYRYSYLAPSNTGVQSGIDLDSSGVIGDLGDAYGFGFFPGQYGMVLLSKYPIAQYHVRTFREFLWKDMPGALLPDDESTPVVGDWYSDQALDVFRLSSKSHWDIPVKISGRLVHVLASHPTPPVFDGPEDRNGRRNHDEIRFWADYISPEKSAYIYDDKGRLGGLDQGELFVVMGDLNADPEDGDSTNNAIGQLLDHEAINTAITPVSEGAAEAALLQGGANDFHVGGDAFDTADFSDVAPGNLRVDYVLPSKFLHISQAGVFWPTQSQAEFELVGEWPFPSSDHRLTWVDIEKNKTLYFNPRELAYLKTIRQTVYGYLRPLKANR